MNLPISQAGKIDMIIEMMKTEEVCPTCGHVTELQPLISIEDAKKLLGIEDDGENFQQ